MGKPAGSRRKNPGKRSTDQRPAGVPLPERPAAGAARGTVICVCLFLAAITFAVFGQTFRHQFVNFDDGPYVYENPFVTNGLSSTGIQRAFTHGEGGTWDPATTMSHMVDCQVYGLQPGGHHLTNVLLHTASVILLFLVLRRMTGALWPSAFAAVLFAIHPLHVESVAWVSERKDTLSGFFFMLTLAAYVFYTAGPPKLSRYLTLMLCFALGLMSKAMLVTLPVILLLLDYWPLKRLAGFGVGEKIQPTILRKKIILEKVPLFALSLASTLAAMLAQKQGHGLELLESLPFGLRLENAVVSVATYIWQMFWPSGLAVFYPFPVHGVDFGKVALAILALMAISAGVFRWRRERPYLAVGWLWYLIMVLPVIGIIQLGGQAHADRYTYLPQIGLYIALAWLANSAWTGWRQRQIFFSLAGAVVVMALSIAAFIQTESWQDNVSLWTHTIASTPDNAIAHYGLAMGYLEKQQEDAAMPEFQKAVDIQPDYPSANYNLGQALAKRGRLDEAITRYQAGVKAKPDFAEAHASLANAFAHRGRLDEAILQYHEALKLAPDDLLSRYNLGSVLLGLGRLSEADEQFEAMLAVRPDLPAARAGLLHIAWILATCPDPAVRDGGKAVQAAQQLVGASGNGNSMNLATLAAAYAETGRFTDATATAERGRQAALAETNAGMAGLLQEQIKLYQAQQPYRDLSLTNVPVRR